MFTQTQGAITKIGKKPTSKSNAVIYGRFIQRLGFSSGGFPQDIRLLNLNTNTVYSFRVKKTFKSRKEDNFLYSLEPGTYAILNYFWTRSTWYGGEMHFEPIFKGIDARRPTNTSAAPERFQFTIAPNSINYMGTWHFDVGMVFFTDDKAKNDLSASKKHKQYDLSKAVVNLPE